MNDSVSYQVTTEVFEGPLDLLLNLISKHEIDIYDISISKITDEYLEYIKQIKELNLDIASEFLLMAATLLEIKSHRLLPVGNEAGAEELTAEEIQKELIKRLINYRKFKNAASFLEFKIAEGIKYHARSAELEERFIDLMPDFTTDLDVSYLTKSMVDLLRRHYYSTVDSSHITPIPVKVEDQIEFLNRELILKQNLSFRDVTENFPKVKVVATFLAMLELYKKGLIEINQAKTFGDIEVFNRQKAKGKGKK